MRLTIDNIRTDPAFVMLDKLHYDSIVDFATEYLRKRTRSIAVYLVLIILFFLIQWTVHWAHSVFRSPPWLQE